MICGAESITSQGIDNGFENINYGEVAFDTVLGGVLGATGGQNKGVAKHLMTQGKNASKRVLNQLTHNGINAARKEVKKAAKYYVSQTAKLFYKPLFKGIARETVKSTAINISIYYGEKGLKILFP